MTPLQIAKCHCDNYQADGLYPLCTAKTEREMAALYCEPRAYYQSVEFIAKEAPLGLFTFNELNKPEKWLEAVSKYLALTGQDAISQAAKQLFRLVEEARKEFREAQDRAWGDRKVTEHTPESYEKRELAAWEKFNLAKRQCLARYEHAIATGTVTRPKRKTARICPRCKQEPLLVGQRKCPNCRAAARRERNRRYASRLKDRLKTGSLLGISRPKGHSAWRSAENKQKRSWRLMSRNSDMLSRLRPLRATTSTRLQFGPVISKTL
jgi:hypothetical protein